MNYLERRYRHTHSRIRETFEKLILELPFRDVSVTHLCTEACINRKTFYLHYESMEALMEELIDEMVCQIQKFLEQSQTGISTPVMEGKLEGFFCLLSQRQELHKRLICSPDYAFAFHRITDKLAQYNAEYTHMADVPDQFFQQVVTRFLTSSVMPIYRDWLMAGKPVSEKQLAAYVEKLMLHGLNSMIDT